MRVYGPLLSALLTLTLGCGSEPEKIPTQFLVGYAEVDVTPPIGDIMGGYGPPGGYRRSTGVHDPIKAQVAVIANDAPQAMVIVTMDTVGFFHDYEDWGPGVKAIREQIVKKAGGNLRLKPEHILFGSSHSHSGPDLTGFWQQNNQGPDADYLNTLLEKIPQAAKEAVGNLQPGTMHFGMTELVGYSGRSEDCSDVVDNSVAIMQARDLSGAPVFTIANYARHPTELGSNNTLYSADYIWGYREEMQARTGAPAMFLQGAIAAVHGGPLGPTGDTDFDQAYDMGRIIADAVEAALPDLQQSQSFQIRHAYATAECEMRSDLIKTVRENMHIPKRYMTMKGPDNKEMWVDEVPISWHQIGDAEIASYPGEATPEMSLLTKEQMVRPTKFLVGLGDDEIGYLIDQASIDKDTSGRLEGYELTMGMGDHSGQCVWDAQTQLGWFGGAFIVE